MSSIVIYRYLGAALWHRLAYNVVLTIWLFLYKNCNIRYLYQDMRLIFN